MECVNIDDQYDDTLSSLKIKKSTNFCTVPNFVITSDSDKFSGDNMKFMVVEL